MKCRWPFLSMVYGGSQFTFGFATAGFTTGAAVAFAAAGIAATLLELEVVGAGVVITGAETAGSAGVVGGAALAVVVAGCATGDGFDCGRMTSAMITMPATRSSAKSA